MEKNIENFNVPEKREERIERLKDAVKVLKSDFVGLDNIIDEVCKLISPWYITPELIRRPVIISLWGMTGTGKTSLVKHLINLLGLAGKTLSFDCGLEANSNSVENIGLSIEDVISSDETVDKSDITRNMVFVFDEFQYARTIDEAGCDDLKSPLRPVWNLLDDGLITINSYRYDINYFKDFVEDFAVFVESDQSNYNIKLNRGEVTDFEDKKRLIDGLGIFYFDNLKLPDAAPKKKGKKKGGEEEDDLFSESEEPINVFGDRILRVIHRKLNSFKAGLGAEIVTKIKTQKDAVLGDIVEELKKYLKIITAPKIIDCSQSLVFILGNLDEAFSVGDEINPDFDADVFYDITSKVTVSDIKEALKIRFRPEQIARFGNNLIKYPTLKKEHFEKIIKKELDTIFTDFKTNDGIEVKYGDDVLSLVYSESVYPVQGVRPIFTTIGSLITPLLSDILLENDKDNKTVTIKVKDPEEVWKEKEFKLAKITLSIKFEESGKEIEKDLKLQLGELRDPESKKTRFINSVHEAGHAIAFSYCRGIAPINIVSISSGNGGFCSVYDKDREGEIDCRDDVKKDVIVSLGGYEAEELVYGKENHDKCLMGSSCDIDAAWSVLSKAAYTCGYFDPILFSSRDTEVGVFIPSGYSDNSPLLPDYFGKKSNQNIQDKIMEEFIELKKKTKEILKNEKKLLKELALYLGRNGSMKSDKFLEFVEKYGNKLTPEFMKEVREKNDNFYFDVLNDLEVE